MFEKMCQQTSFIFCANFFAVNDRLTPQLRQYSIGPN